MNKRTTAYGVDLMKTSDFASLTILIDKLNAKFSTKGEFFCLSPVNSKGYKHVIELIKINLYEEDIKTLKSSYLQRLLVDNFIISDLKILIVKHSKEPYLLEIADFNMLVNVFPYRDIIPT